MDRRTLFRAVKDAGWTVDDRGKHLAIRDGEGRRIATCARTPSCPRAIKNLRADLRRAGLLV